MINLLTQSDAPALGPAAGMIPAAGAQWTTPLDPIAAQRLPWFSDAMRRYVYHELSPKPEELAAHLIESMAYAHAMRERLPRMPGRRDLFTLPPGDAPVLHRPTDEMLIDVARPLVPELIWTPR
jgi:hypothetical protein